MPTFERKKDGKKPKPAQPVRTVRELIEHSVQALPRFDQLMTQVAAEAKQGDEALGASPGGVR